jgi:macrolide transport system ATP-binding/permease protein
VSGPDAAGTPVVWMQGIEKTYLSGEVVFRALRGVDISIQQGEFVAIGGPSGSGKSTLMNLIGCLDRPSAGRYLLAGHDVSDLDADARSYARNQLIGFVFQGFNLLSRTSALENVELPLIYRGMGGRERRRRAEAALERVGLAGKFDNTPAQLSGGQQQRVAIARALVTEPRVLLADEPTGNLDTVTTEDVLELLQTLHREQGLTIVMVTHEPEVAGCAGRVVVVRDGLIASDRIRGQPPPGRPRQRGAQPLARAEARSRAMTMWLMAVRLALRSLNRNKLRAGLTVLGILIGVAAVVAMTALGDGARANIESQLGALGTNLLMVFPGANTSGGVRSEAGARPTLSEDDGEAIRRELYTVRAVAPVLGAAAQVVVGARNAATRVTGSTPAYLEVRAWPLARGRGFTDVDMRTSARVCLLGETVRQNLFGSSDPIGASIRIGRLPCNVIGLLAPKGKGSFGNDYDDTIVMPISTVRSRLRGLQTREVNQLLVSVREAELMPRTQEQVIALLRQRHRIGANDENDFSVGNMQDIMATLEQTRSTLSALLLAVAAIALLVGGIGVMNIMLVSVTERTREIGIRLAVGARSGDILAQFLVEAVALSVLGGLAGLGVGWAAGTALANVMNWTVSFSPTAAAIALGTSSAIGVVFGYFPARRAAHLDPIQALRHE